MLSKSFIDTEYEIFSEVDEIETFKEMEIYKTIDQYYNLEIIEMKNLGHLKYENYMFFKFKDKDSESKKIYYGIAVDYNLGKFEEIKKSAEKYLNKVNNKFNIKTDNLYCMINGEKRYFIFFYTEEKIPFELFELLPHKYYQNSNEIQHDFPYTENREYFIHK